MRPSEIIDKLRTQIERTDCKNERACGLLLKEIAWILLPIEQELTFTDAEIVHSTGRSDLAIIADATLPNGKARREAYVWELKAPQFSLFQIDTNNRARPTNELYDAENQLLHYYKSCSDSDFRDLWDIQSPQDVRLGGIIIGRHLNFIKPRKKIEAQKANVLAERASSIRETIFYRHNQMKLFTWDGILYIAQKLKQSHQWKKGDVVDLRIESETAV